MVLRALVGSVVLLCHQLHIYNKNRNATHHSVKRKHVSGGLALGFGGAYRRSRGSLRTDTPCGAGLKPDGTCTTGMLALKSVLRLYQV